MATKNKTPRFDFYYSGDGANRDRMVIRRVWDSGRGGIIGREFDKRIWLKYVYAGKSILLLNTLIKFDERQWDSFLMMEAMSDGELTI